MRGAEAERLAAGNDEEEEAAAMRSEGSAVITGGGRGSGETVTGRTELNGEVETKGRDERGEEARTVVAGWTCGDSDVCCAEEEASEDEEATEVSESFSSLKSASTSSSN